jgi:hypothetical protein
MRTGQPEYRAAVTEFDRLWETGAAGRQPERMQQLLQVIDAVEVAPLRSRSRSVVGADLDHQLAEVLPLQHADEG